MQAHQFVFLYNSLIKTRQGGWKYIVDCHL